MSMTPEAKAAFRAAVREIEAINHRMAEHWRADAFEAAAQICERYDAHDAARDIRALKPKPAEGKTGEQK